MKNFIGIIVLTVLLCTLAACTSKGSYAAILIVDGKEYYGQENVDPKDYTINKIGKVENTVDKEIVPKNNFSSNALKIGTEVYKINDNKKSLIVRIDDGEYQLFNV